MRTSAYVTAQDIDQQLRLWLDAIRGSSAPRSHLRPDPSRCALLVVDMNRYFAHPRGRCFLPATEAIVPRVSALVRAWRELGAPVVFTRHGHRCAGDLGALGRFFSDWIRHDEPDAELIDALSPEPGEPVIPKTTYDAFLGTGLHDHLQGLGVDQVLVTGVLTHMCCETTARAAFCRGYDVFVAADGTASSDERRHLCSLSNMADAVAVVLSSREVLDLCDG